MEPATAGLNVIASPLGEWARQGVRTMSPEYSWVGASSPVTYSLTIGEHSEQLRHEIYLYFVPNGALPATATAPDWSETVCAVVNIDRHGDGTTPGGWMRFAYKNDPENGSASNGRPGHEYWDVNDGSNSDGGQVAFATSTTMTGTWSVTIANNTEVTVTTPDGQTASGVLHPDAAALFAGDLYVYCGAHPGGIVGNVGRAIIFDAFAITGGVANPLTVDLAGEIFDPAVLERAADGPAGIVQVVRGDTPFWLKWSLPAPGFLLYQSTTLKAGEWEELALDDAFTRGGTERWKPLSLSGGLLDAATGYFQLARPE